MQLTKPAVTKECHQRWWLLDAHLYREQLILHSYELNLVVFILSYNQ